MNSTSRRRHLAERRKTPNLNPGSALAHLRWDETGKAERQRVHKMLLDARRNKKEQQA